MALTIIATVGATNANSFGTLEEAELYFEGRFVSGEGWSGFTENEKKSRLIAASRMMNRLRYIGVPTDLTQYLAWPRTSDTYQPTDMWAATGRIKVLGKYYERNQIPDDVKWAQFELALVIFDENGLVSPAGSHTASGGRIRSETLGKWSVSYDNAEGSPPLSEFSNEAASFLAPFLVDTVRLERA